MIMLNEIQLYSALQLVGILVGMVLCIAGIVIMYYKNKAGQEPLSDIELKSKLLSSVMWKDSK